SSAIQSNKQLIVSRLEISFALEVNSGGYQCEAKNNAGVAGKNFTALVVSPLQYHNNSTKIVAAAAASPADLDRKAMMNETHTGCQPNGVLCLLVCLFMLSSFPLSIITDATA